MGRLALVATVLALLTAAIGSDGAYAGSPTHFAGVPPYRTHASTPTTGKLLLSFSVKNLTSHVYATWNVYADGRVIWQKWSPSGDPVVIPPGARMSDTAYVQQRLTPQGLRLVRARILSTGLFEHNLRLRIARHHPVIWTQGRVRRGDHLVTFTGWPHGVVSGHEPLTKATPAQARGLSQIQALLADTAAWSLPTTAWAHREVRDFVPSHYFLAFDRSAPDLTKLPASLLPYKTLFSHGPTTCEIVTTAKLRAIVRAVREAGIPVSDGASWIAFPLKGFHGTPSAPHFSPVLPADPPC